MTAAGTQAAAPACTDEMGLQVHKLDPERKVAFGQFMTPKSVEPCGYSTPAAALGH